jgi:hypothetical protein
LEFSKSPAVQQVKYANREGKSSKMEVKQVRYANLLGLASRIVGGASNASNFFIFFIGGHKFFEFFIVFICEDMRASKFSGASIRTEASSLLASLVQK